jgi:hypothetical protein
MNTTRRSLLMALPAWPALALAQATPSAKAPATATTNAPAAPPRVVLSITGRINKRNAGERMDIDMATLAALPQQSFTTATPWFDKPVKFTGPLLRDVLALADAQGTQLTAVALNDYKIDLPLEDAKRWNVIMARLLDDKPMSTREKGPLFIVYPFQESAELRSERYYSRSAWQLRTLIVK